MKSCGLIDSNENNKPKQWKITRYYPSNGEKDGEIEPDNDLNHSTQRNTNVSVSTGAGAGLGLGWGQGGIMFKTSKNLLQTDNNEVQA